MNKLSKNYMLLHKYICALEKDVWWKINSITTDQAKINIIIDIIKMIIDEQDYPEEIDYISLSTDHQSFRIKKTVIFYKLKSKKNGTNSKVK